jgi:polyisoprenoid-binding protein YceI
MKKTLVNVLGGATLMLLLSSCGNKASNTEGEKTAAQADSAAKEYVVSSEESSLGWTATKKIGGGHNGKIKLSSGNLNLAGSEVKAGKFDIDMKSISCDDITDPKKNADFLGHMSSDDFFSVENFPMSSFEITGSEKAAEAGMTNVKGNLTIKGITKNITIPAKVTVEGETAKVAADFSIDRTEWDIKYNSGKFFTDLGDRIINDNIDFKLDLSASLKK